MSTQITFRFQEFNRMVFEILGSFLNKLPRRCSGQKLSLNIDSSITNDMIFFSGNGLIVTFETSKSSLCVNFLTSDAVAE